MTEPMIERMAKAILAPVLDQDYRDRAWEALPADKQSWYVTCAREALRAAGLPSTLRYPDRLRRADVLTQEVMREITPAIELNEGDPESDSVRRDIARALHTLFFISGVEVITDADREAAGLLPRDQNGLTALELQIMELRLQQAMLEVKPIIVPANTALGSLLGKL